MCKIKVEVERDRLDEIQKLIDAQESKIKSLKEEIDLYRTILKEVGVQLEDGYQQFERMRPLGEPQTIVARTVHCFIDKKFAVYDEPLVEATLVKHALERREHYGE